jgi:hypothetical protein
MCLTFSEYVQLGIFVATFAAVIVALFGENIREWIKKPNISLTFNQNSDRCFRKAPIQTDSIQKEPYSPFKNVERAYYRLKVENKKGFAKNVKVEIDIFDSEENEIQCFEPSLLRWISGNEKEDLTKGKVDYVNICSQVISPCQKPSQLQRDKKEVTISRRLRIELFNNTQRGIYWDLKFDNYIFKIRIYGDNFNPFPKKYKFEKPSSDTQLGNLVEIG